MSRPSNGLRLNAPALKTPSCSNRTAPQLVVASRQQHTCSSSCAHGDHSTQAVGARQLSSAKQGNAIKTTAAIARDKTGPFTIDQVLLREPRHNELLVRVVATGICHTDIAVKERFGPFPIVLGHEGSGVVERVGSGVTGVKPGDHVVMSYASCGSCDHCAHGKPAYCYDHGSLNFAGTHPDGSTNHRFLNDEKTTLFGAFFQQSSFAQHAIVPERSVVKVPKDLALDLVAPLGCGVQTGAGAVFNTLQAKAGSSIAIFGCGAVGLSAIMAANVTGCSHIVALDVKPSRLELAKKLGATHTIAVNPSTKVPDELKEITQGGINFALDTSGNPRALRSAFEALRPMGIVGLIGGSPPGTDVPIDMLSLLNGRVVRGVIQGDSVSKTFLPTLIQLYRNGRFPFDKMITYYDGGLAEINRAVEEAHRGDVIKAVLRLGKP